MGRKQTRARKTAQRESSISGSAAMSFLKETRGLLTWTSHDVQKSLLVSAAEARQVIAVLELQGYVKQAEDEHQWMTTIHGEAVSGSKAPRFKTESVDASLSALRERLRSGNRDAHSGWIVTEAVAFGDFLAGRAQAQAADVGIQLGSPGQAARNSESAKERTSKLAFLKTLRARDLRLKLQFYERWMSERSHHDLLR
jgi:hypothetical protein